MANEAAGQPIPVGVAGLGRAGWDIHVRALKKLPELFKVVAALDGLAERRAQAAAELGCRTYEQFDDLLADPGVALVVVAMPTQFHADWSIAALAAGKDVVCEKPVARDLAECDRMMAAEQRAGRRLAVFQNRRYEPAFLKLREVVASGVLGRLAMVRACASFYRRRWDWQTVRALGGGMLRNHGAHYLDLLMEFAGPKEPTVFCQLDRVLASGDAEDFVRLTLSAPDAPLLEMDIFSNCAYPLPDWLVLGQKGTLLGDAKELKWKVVKGFDALPAHEVDLGPVPGRSYSQETLEFEEFAWKLPKDAERMEVAYYRALHPALRARTAPPVNTAGIRRRMAVIDRCLAQA